MGNKCSKNLVILSIIVHILQTNIADIIDYTLWLDILIILVYREKEKCNIFECNQSSYLKPRFVFIWFSKTYYSAH